MEQESTQWARQRVDDLLRADAKPGLDKVGRNLVIAGGVLYLGSWFLPVCRGEDWLGPGEMMLRLVGDTRAQLSLPEGPDWLPGWQAVRAAWWMLTTTEVPSDEVWRWRVLGSTSISNLVMLSVILCSSRQRAGLLGGLALVACAAWDGSWLYLQDSGKPVPLLLGYYGWLASFVLVGVGFLCSGVAVARPRPA